MALQVFHWSRLCHMRPWQKRRFRSYSFKRNLSVLVKLLRDSNNLNNLFYRRTTSALQNWMNCATISSNSTDCATSPSVLPLPLFWTLIFSCNLSSQLCLLFLCSLDFWLMFLSVHRSHYFLSSSMVPLHIIPFTLVIDTFVEFYFLEYVTNLLFVI